MPTPETVAKQITELRELSSVESLGNVTSADIDYLIEDILSDSSNFDILQSAMTDFSDFGRVYTDDKLRRLVDSYKDMTCTEQSKALIDCLHEKHKDLYDANSYQKICLVQQDILSPSFPGMVKAISDLPYEEQELCALVVVNKQAVIRNYTDKKNNRLAFRNLQKLLRSLRNSGYRYIFLHDAGVFYQLFNRVYLEGFFREEFLRYNYKIIVGGVFSDMLRFLLSMHGETDSELRYVYVLPKQMSKDLDSWKLTLQKTYATSPEAIVKLAAKEAFYQDKFLAATYEAYGWRQRDGYDRKLNFYKGYAETPEELPQSMLDITYYCTYSTFAGLYDSIKLDREYQEFMTELASRLPEPYSYEFSLEKLRDTEAYALIYNTGLVRTATTDDGKKYDYISHSDVARYCGQMLLDGLAKKFSLPTAKLEEATAALEEYVAEHQTILAKTFALSKIGNFYSFER